MGGGGRGTVANAIADGGDGDDDGGTATDTVTDAGDATIVANGKKVSSSFLQEAGIQTQGQQVGAERCR